MVTFSGIGSGVDFTSLIDATVQAERAPIRKVEAQKTSANKKSTIFADLVTKLKNFELKAKELDTKSELFGGKPLPGEVVETTNTKRQVMTSNAERVQATVSDSAFIGNYKIQTSRLATAQVSQTEAFATDEAGAAGSGSFGISVGDNERVDIEFTYDDSLADIAQRINQSGAGVQAAVGHDENGYRLVITGQVGEDNAINFTSVTGPDLGFGSNLVQAAQDSLFSVNGVSMTRGSNEIDDAVQGAKLYLLNEGPEETVITIAEKPAEAGEETSYQGEAFKKVKDLVDAYNEVAKVLQTQLSNDGAGNKDKLFGDATLQSLQRTLSLTMTTGIDFGDSTFSLGSFGMKYERDGTISIDQTKFETAVTNDPAAFQAYIYGEEGDGGLVAELKSVTDRFTESVTGVLPARQARLKQDMTNYDQQIADIEDRASELGDRMRDQFAALDEIMVKLNSQIGYLSSLFA